MTDTLKLIMECLDGVQKRKAKDYDEVALQLAV
jgi:hypothetical protein